MPMSNEELLERIRAEQEAKKVSTTDEVVKGTAGAAIGGTAGWALGTLATLGAAAIGITAAPVIIPLAVGAGIAVGAAKGSKKLWD